MAATKNLSLAQLRKMLAQTPGVDVFCTGSQHVISVWDEDAQIWRHHAQPWFVDEHDAIRKALRMV